MIATSEDGLEYGSSLIASSDSDESVDVPEGTNDESGLRPTEIILLRIAVRFCERELAALQYARSP